MHVVEMVITFQPAFSMKNTHKALVYVHLSTVCGRYDEDTVIIKVYKF